MDPDPAPLQLVLHEGLILLLGLKAGWEIDKLLLDIGQWRRRLALSLGLGPSLGCGLGLGLGLEKARLESGDIVELHCRHGTGGLFHT